MDVSEETRNDLMEFQNLQQQLQLIAMQNQQTAVQLQDLEKALGELEKTEEKQQLYKMVGGIFVQKKKEALKKELEEERESLNLRKGTFEKQEKKITDRLESLKKKIESALPKGEGAKFS